MFFFGGGKCPNLGGVNVRIWGVVNVRLANDSHSDSYVADSMKEAGFRQAVMGRYPSETVYLYINHFSLFFLAKQQNI